MYPNPTSGELTLEFDNPVAGEVEFSVVDFSGKMLFNLKHNLTKGTQKVDLDLRELNDGLYLININSNGASFSKKMVVKH